MMNFTVHNQTYVTKCLSGSKKNLTLDKGNTSEIYTSTDQIFKTRHVGQCTT